MRSRLRALTMKETHQLLRDPSSLAVGVLLPIILILLFGYGLSLDVKKAPLAVVMEDASPTAARAVMGLGLTPYIASIPVASMREAERLMSERRVDGIVRIPSDFSNRLAQGDARIQLIANGVDSTKARIILSYAASALGQGLARLELVPAEARIGEVVLDARLWFNVANTSTWYLVPGLIVIIMTLVGAFLTALVVAREWERGTFEALFVTPVRTHEILIAKVIPYFAVGLVGLSMCLVAARLLFQVPMEGSYLVLLAGSMVYLLVAVAIGLVISSVTRNQFLASQLALILSFMPSLILSGFTFDLRNVPVVVSWIGHVLPATHYMEMLRTLFLAGNIWPSILKHIAVLVVYAVVLFAIAHRVTRKRLD